MRFKGSEKRKYLRIPTNIRCDIFNMLSSISMGRGYIVDFSLGGLGLATTLELDPGTDVRLRLNLLIRKLAINVIIVNVRQIMGNVFIYGTKYSQLNIFGKLKLKINLTRWLKLKK